MKKGKKIIIPIATALATAGVVTPLVVACNKNEKVVAKIAIGGDFTTEYFEGNTLDLNGIEVTITYNDETTETLDVDDWDVKPNKGKFITSPSKGTPLTKNDNSFTITYGGKTSEPYSITVQEDVLDSISIATEPTDKVFYTGQTFNSNGLVLTAKYISGETESITSGYSTSEDNHRIAAYGMGDIQNDKTVTVTYEGKEATYTIDIREDIVDSIEITTEPEHKQFYVGETFNTTGMVLTATYASGRTETIEDGWTTSLDEKKITPFTDDDIETGKTVVVTYEDQTATYTIDVLENTVTKIEIDDYPIDLEYYVHQKLDTTGMSLKVSYASGGEVTVYSGWTTDPSTEEQFTVANPEQEIKVYYGGKETSFTVKVEEDIVTAIGINSMPVKTEYAVGDAFDTTGLSLDLEYISGYAEEGVTEDIITRPEDGYEFQSQDVADALVVEVYYKEISETLKTSFNVKVTDPITGIEIETQPTQTTFYVGQTFNTDNMVLTVHHTSGFDEEVTSGWTTNFDKYITTEFGEGDLGEGQTVIVEYEGKKATYTINVREDSVTGIEIKTEPTDKVFYVGQNFNTTGMVLEATYASGDKETITEGWTTNFDYFRENAFTDEQVDDQQTVEVTYEGQKDTYTIDVKANAVTSIVVDYVGKDTYKVGEPLDLSNTTVTAYYADGTTTADVTNDVTWSKNPSGAPIEDGYTFKNEDIGTFEAVATYEEGGVTKTDMFSVTVDPATFDSITVNNTGKTEYENGEELDLSGAMVTAHYSDGTSKDVTGSAVFTPDTYTFDEDDAGDFPISVTYTDTERGVTHDTTFTVHVNVVYKVEIGQSEAEHIENMTVDKIFGEESITITCDFGSSGFELDPTQTQVLVGDPAQPYGEIKVMPEDGTVTITCDAGWTIDTPIYVNLVERAVTP